MHAMKPLFVIAVWLLLGLVSQSRDQGAAEASIYSYSLLRDLRMATANQTFMFARQAPTPWDINPPQGWLWNNFPTQNNMILNAVKSHLIDAMLAAFFAIDALQNQDTTDSWYADDWASFDRWFHGTDPSRIEAVFYHILEEGRAIPCVQPQSYSAPTIFFGDAPTLLGNCNQPGLLAYTQTRYTSSSAENSIPDLQVSVCPLWFTAVGQRRLGGIPCSDLASQIVNGQLYYQATSEVLYEGGGALLLHELIHVPRISGYGSNAAIDMVFNGYPDGKSRIAYDAWGSFAIAQQWQRGWRNDNNFVFFALERYFARRCGHGFTDPVFVNTNRPTTNNPLQLIY